MILDKLKFITCNLGILWGFNRILSHFRVWHEPWNQQSFPWSCQEITNMVYNSLVLLRSCLRRYQGTCVLLPPTYHTGRTHRPELINPKIGRLVSSQLWRFLPMQAGPWLLGACGRYLDGNMWWNELLTSRYPGKKTTVFARHAASGLC